jgi:hypothetical protein
MGKHHSRRHRNNQYENIVEEPIKEVSIIEDISNDPNLKSLNINNATRNEGVNIKKDSKTAVDVKGQIAQPKSLEDNCEITICESKPLPQCNNIFIEPSGCKGPLVAKVPVVLSDFEVEIDLDSTIKLDTPALEIKRIKKNIFLKQCSLVPETNLLFISGYIRKNIEYASARSSSKRGISGSIKHTTVHIPFDCVTKIQFSKEPHFSKTSVPQEIQYSDATSLGSSLSETTRIEYEYFNEKIFCEIEYASFYEVDINENLKTLKDSLPNEHMIETLKQKMVVHLRLRLLQNQLINIS